MTPERRKYFSSISDEEKEIRIALLEARTDLSLAKYEKKNYGTNIRDIESCKTIIEILKKQLPAPVRFVRDGKWAYNSCSVCKGAINEDELYCHNCGQKLR